MMGTQSARRSTPLTRRVVLSVAIVIVTVSTLTTASLALFTDTEQVPGNVFGTGTVDITSQPASAIMSAPLMVPGEPVVAPLDITNSGTLDVRYAALSTTSEDTFAALLEMTVKVGVADCSAAGFDASGTIVYGPGVLGTVSGTRIFGDPTEGADPGDRPLASSASEELCFQVVLPVENAATAAGLETVANFSFDAEQTLNNP